MQFIESDLSLTLIGELLDARLGGSKRRLSWSAWQISRDLRQVGPQQT